MNFQSIRISTLIKVTPGERTKNEKNKPVSVAEMPGNQYDNLHGCQEGAMVDISSGLAGTMRNLLARGVLLVVDGKIIKNTNQDGMR
jgi:hypothetical protein